MAKKVKTTPATLLGITYKCPVILDALEADFYVPIDKVDYDISSSDCDNVRFTWLGQYRVT